MPTKYIDTVLFLGVSSAAAERHGTSVHYIPTHRRQATDSVLLSVQSVGLTSADTATALSLTAHFLSASSVFNKHSTMLHEHDNEQNMAANNKADVMHCPVL